MFCDIKCQDRVYYLTHGLFEKYSQNGFEGTSTTSPLGTIHVIGEVCRI